MLAQALSKQEIQQNADQKIQEYCECDCYDFRRESELYEWNEKDGIKRSSRAQNPFTDIVNESVARSEIPSVTERDIRIIS